MLLLVSNKDDKWILLVYIVGDEYNEGDRAERKNEVLLEIVLKD